MPLSAMARLLVGALLCVLLSATQPCLGQSAGASRRLSRRLEGAQKRLRQRRLSGATLLGAAQISTGPPPRPPPPSPPAAKPPAQPPPRTSPAPPSPPRSPTAKPPPPPYPGLVHPPDAAILLGARAAWGGARVIPSWNAATPCKGWGGVACDGAGRAVALSLRDYGLSGDIPSSLGGLSGLQQLDLSDNSLSGSIPDTIGALTRLRALRLYNNSLTGSIPSSLGSITGLQTLWLNANELTGPIPASAGNWTRLQDIDLSANQLSGPLPSGVASWTAISSMQLSGNELSGSLPSSLANLTQLRYLYLADNQLSGGIPGSLGAWFPLLQQLDLSSNRLTGQLPTNLSKLTGLVSLQLSYNQLSGSLPSSIGSLTRLQILAVEYNLLSGSIPFTIGNLTALQNLTLNANGLSGYLPSTICNITRIESLYLSNNQLSGALPACILPSKFAGDDILLDANRFTGRVPSLRPGSLVPQGWDLSDNLLFGSCPQLNSTSLCPDLELGCLESLASGFLNNCFDDCSLGSSFTLKQRSQGECSYACGSDQPLGPCRGKGTCFIEGPNNVATCQCHGGFVSPASNPGTCVPAPAAAPPPPPAPPPANVTQGLSFLHDTLTMALNRWSRYLSANYKPQNGVPRWIIGSDSSWMASGSLFLSYNPDNAGVSGLLKWGATRDQGACAACWAMAATDAVAAAQAIAGSSAGGDVPALSVAQVLGCSANGTSGTCSGDYPTTALEYAASSGLQSNASFQAGDTCPSIPPPPAIVMYEWVQFRGWFGLLLTLQKQPALVLMEAGASFQQETCASKKLVFQDPSCYSGNLDHTVLVVGYDISALYPYWVIRNSWGNSWCYGGYMRMAIQGGNGVCGMNILPAYYPVAAPPAGDPCYTNSTIPDGDSVPALNPCGGGTCKAAPSLGNYSYTCTCPRGFVAVNNTVQVNLPGAGLGITQTCAPVDACSLTLTNPCVVGTCVNDGKGSYSCLCPIGYFSDTTADGRGTCSLGLAPARLTVQPGVTCCLISAAYNITREQLLKQNPGLNCSDLSPGQVVKTANPSFSCDVSYTVTGEHRTFDSIASIVLKPKKEGVSGITAERLRALNPTAVCSADGRLAKGQVICLEAAAKAGTWYPDGCSPVCNLLYKMQPGDTCTDVTDRYFATNPIPFYKHNPGIDCGAVSDPSPGADKGPGASGVQVCLGIEPVGARLCPAAATKGKAPARTALYVGLKGDTCAKVLNTRCKDFKDTSTFKPDAFLSMNKVPDCRDVKGFQFCCPA